MSDLNDRDKLPDRELDALIAEKVMGLVPCTAEAHDDVNHPRHVPRPCHAQPDSPTRGGETRCYSTDISAAMEVVHKMRSLGWSFACTLYEGKLPYASFCKLTAASSRNAEAETLPRAICLAALSTVGDDK